MSSRKCVLRALSWIGVVLLLGVCGGMPRDAGGEEPQEIGNTRSGQVKVAVVQFTGYDKTDLPRPGFDPASTVAAYVERAGKDGAELVVFPEYVLGRIRVPGPETAKIAEQAAKHQIYVIVGCWELLDPEQPNADHPSAAPPPGESAAGAAGQEGDASAARRRRGVRQFGAAVRPLR